MKFTVSSDELKEKLVIASGAISSSPVLPILEDYLFNISANKLIIMATDLDTSIVTELSVQADSEGSVAIPAKILLDTLKALPTQPLTFTIDQDSFAVEITTLNGQYKLAGENGSDFPKTPVMDDVDSVKVRSSVLLSAISKSLFAVSNDEMRPAMNGVYFQIDFNTLTFVATDAHKLVRYTFNDVESSVNTSFIVPKKGLNLLKSALPADELITISFNKTNVFFEYEGVNLVCRLIDGRFPDYNAAIPQNNPNKMTIGRSELQNTLKRIAIYANKTTNQVALHITDGKLTVNAQDLDFSNEATEQLPCTLEGEAISIGFSAKFLAEILGVLDSDQVIFELSVPSRAGLILPTQNKPSEELTMLLMPIMINS